MRTRRVRSPEKCDKDPSILLNQKSTEKEPPEIKDHPLPETLALTSPITLNPSLLQPTYRPRIFPPVLLRSSPTFLTSFNISSTMTNPSPTNSPPASQAMPTSGTPRLALR